MKIYNNTIIYILCPAHQHSGGPELLHQLGAQLISQGIETYMFYLAIQSDDPVFEGYKMYNVPYETAIIDRPENIMIFSETCLSAYYSTEHIRRVIWWLSVDHYLMNVQDYIGNLLKDPIAVPLPRFYQLGDQACEYHLVQSEYARRFLKVNKVEDKLVDYLGDYLNDEFLINAASYLSLEKRDIVLFNPKKGLEFTLKLMKASPELHWVPIQNLTPHQVSLLLAGAKVYVDFGYHPGKDRIPREAAVCGCCVLTNRKGAAANDIDVPIPAEYKFDDTEENIPAIIERIKEVFADYPSHAARFESYRAVIHGEHEAFIRDCERVFAK